MDEDIGWEAIGMDEAGAMVKRHKKTGRIRLSRPPIASTAPQGSGGIHEKRVPLGLGTFQFVAAGVTAHDFQTAPQRSFQGERLVVDFTRGGGAVAGVRLTSLKIGDTEQLPSGLGMPASAFASTAVDSYLDLTSCDPAVQITARIEISAVLGAGETIDVDCGLFGRVVGQ